VVQGHPAGHEHGRSETIDLTGHTGRDRSRGDIGWRSGAALGWERENRPPLVGVSNRCRTCKRRNQAVPSPVGRERVRVRVILLKYDSCLTLVSDEERTGSSPIFSVAPPGPWPFSIRNPRLKPATFDRLYREFGNHRRLLHKLSVEMRLPAPARQTDRCPGCGNPGRHPDRSPPDSHGRR